MTEQITLTVRALQDSKRGVVASGHEFVLVNMTIYVDGKASGIVTVDFQGDEIPTADDFSRELMIVGNETNHPRHGRQFAVSAWAVNNPDPISGPSIRHRKTRRLSPEAIRQLTGNHSRRSNP